MKKKVRKESESTPWKNQNTHLNTIIVGKDMYGRPHATRESCGENIASNHIGRVEFTILNLTLKCSCDLKWVVT